MSIVQRQAKPETSEVANSQVTSSFNSVHNPILNQWYRGSWDEFIDVRSGTDDLNPEIDWNAIHYYYQDGWVLLEMTPLGPEHARSHAIPLDAANLYATFQQLQIVRYIHPCAKRVNKHVNQIWHFTLVRI